jgi:hypothetical protein
MVYIMRTNTITRIIIGVLMIFAVSNVGAAKSGCLPLEKIIETTGGGQNNEIELWAERCPDAQSWKVCEQNKCGQPGENGPSPRTLRVYTVSTLATARKPQLNAKVSTVGTPILQGTNQKEFSDDQIEDLKLENTELKAALDLIEDRWGPSVSMIDECFEAGGVKDRIKSWCQDTLNHIR